MDAPFVDELSAELQLCHDCGRPSGTCQTRETCRGERPPRSGTAYAVERWRDLRAEMIPLLVRHWHEVALNHAEVPLDIDEARYKQLDESGALHIVTARQDGALVGYHVAIVSPHLHYASTLHGVTDVYWIAPERRHGVTALRLFQHVEREMVKLGVRKLFTATKLHLDQGSLFEHMGYRPVERLYAKIIGGK